MTAPVFYILFILAFAAFVVAVAWVWAMVKKQGKTNED